MTQAERLLHVSINDYVVQEGGTNRQFFAPNQDPTIDQSVSDTVISVAGLENYYHMHSNYSHGTAHGSAPYYPQDFANAYDVNPLWNQGFDGTGQHIGIVLGTGDKEPSPTTLGSFVTATQADIATNQPRLNIIPPVNGGQVGLPTNESGMDIEMASAMAPGAVIDYYETDGTNGGVEAALNEAGTDGYDNLQISNSWSQVCETPGSLTPDQQTMNNIFASNAATGHDYLFASGDAGDQCVPLGGEQELTAYFPAASPYVTSVGGTTFLGNSISGTYPGERGWDTCLGCFRLNDGFYANVASGGGYSQVFSRPAWQVGPGQLGTTSREVLCSPSPCRGFPDVSADADATTGAYVCYDANNPVTSTCSTTDTSTWGQGTSLATPLWAGILADINQYLGSRAINGQPPQYAGFINPALYQFAASGVFKAFHDIDDTANPTTSCVGSRPDAICGCNGSYKDYCTGPGWDPMTGLGSPDAWNLAQDFALSPMKWEAEASANTLTGGAYVASCSTCSNGQMVSGVGNGSTLTFNIYVGSAGTYRLGVEYLNPDAPGTSRAADISANSGIAAYMQFPGLGSSTARSMIYATVQLNAGNNTIYFGNNSGPAPNFDYISLDSTLQAIEAESSSNTLTGSAVVASCGGCSGGADVTGIGTTNGVSGTLQFNNVYTYGGGVYRLDIFFINSSGTNRSVTITINGTPSTYTFWNTSGGIDNYRTNIPLAQGSNTITFSNPSGPAVDIDRIMLTTGAGSWEAESSANTLVGAVVQSCSACSGGYKVGYVGEGNTLQFNNVTMGSTGAPYNQYTLRIAYTNGDSTIRTANMSVNGGAPTQISFWPTGSFTTPNYVYVPVTLQLGNNTIQFSNPSGWAPDFDQIVVSANLCKSEVAEG